MTNKKGKGKERRGEEKRREEKKKRKAFSNSRKTQKSILDALKI